VFTVMGISPLVLKHGNSWVLHPIEAAQA
jgi:hypothetical protein